MKFQNIEAVRYNLFFIFILFLGVVRGSFLQGACLEEEKNQITPHYQRVSIKEKPDSESDLSTELDSQSPNNASKSWLLLGSSSRSDDNIEEDITFNGFQSASTSYMQAFQEEEISRFLVLKCITSLILGFGPTIPQIDIAFKVGEYYSSAVLGYFLIATTVLYIEGITSWIISEFIDDTQKLLKTSKYHRTNSNRYNVQSIKNIGIGVLSLLLGALSSAPDVYKAYKYNNVKELSIISFIYDTIPRTLGFYKLLSSLNCTSHSATEEDSLTKTQGVEFINSSKIHFLERCNRDGAMNVLRDLKNCNNPFEIYSYLSAKAQQNIEEDVSHHSQSSVLKKLTENFVLIFPSASAGFNMILAYKGYNLLIDNPILSGFLAGFSVLPPFILSNYVIKRATGDLFDKICQHSSKKSSHYFSIFHPRVNTALVGTSLFLGVTTSIGGFYFADNLDDTFLSSVKYIFVALGMVTDITFGSYTMYSSWVNLGEVIQRISNRKSSYVLNCLKKLDEVGETIINLDTPLVKNFVQETIPHQGDALQMVDFHT